MYRSVGSTAILMTVSLLIPLRAWGIAGNYAGDGQRGDSQYPVGLVIWLPAVSAAKHGVAEVSHHVKKAFADAAIRIPISVLAELPPTGVGRRSYLRAARSLRHQMDTLISAGEALPGDRQNAALLFDTQFRSEQGAGLHKKGVSLGLQRERMWLAAWSVGMTLRAANGKDKGAERKTWELRDDTNQVRLRIHQDRGKNSPTIERLDGATMAGATMNAIQQAALGQLK